MSFIKTIRANEWWTAKLSALLMVGYATAILSRRSLLEVGPYLLYILLALILGAAYVSVINDITDIDEDLAIGKRNRMAGIPPSRRWLFPVLALVAGGGYIYSFYPDVFVMALATMPWIAFSCYSIPPVRLKQRGGLGVLADASGAHLFTSLFVVAAIYHYTGQPIDRIWFGAVGVWAFCYGLRGILWHQFMDRDNDIRSGTRTYATQVEPVNFKLRGRIIMATEIAALGVLLWRLGKPLPVIALIFYLLYVVAAQRKLYIQFIAIQIPPGRTFNIFLADYYQVFLPMALLLHAALNSHYDWILLAAHGILFMGNIKRLLGASLRIAFGDDQRI